MYLIVDNVVIIEVHSHLTKTSTVYTCTYILYTVYTCSIIQANGHTSEQSEKAENTEKRTFMHLASDMQR